MDNSPPTRKQGSTPIPPEGISPPSEEQVEAILAQILPTKRKASTSPNRKIEETDLLAGGDSPKMEYRQAETCKTADYVGVNPEKGGSERFHSPSTSREKEMIVIRSTKKKRLYQEDPVNNKFKELMASRKKKIDKKSSNDYERVGLPVPSISDSDSPDTDTSRLDNIIDLSKEDLPSQKDANKYISSESESSVVSDKTRFRTKNKITKSSSKIAERTSDEGTSSNTQSSKTKTKSTKNYDATFKNPITKPRGRKNIPKVVHRERAALEKDFSREDWLKLSTAELGEAGLAHLAEIERQRYKCGNLSGRTDGMIKDCNAAASNIIGALVKKLETSGDVQYLKTQNVKLREELSAARRKIDSQDQEISELRKSMINLEKEIRALKEGCGPFPQQVKSSTKIDASAQLKKDDNKHFSSERRHDISPQRQMERKERPSLLDLGASNTQLDSEEWPQGPDTMEWNTTLNTKRANETEVARPKDSNSKRRRIHDNRLDMGAGPSSLVPHIPRRNDIRVLENRLLVPPSDNVTLTSDKHSDTSDKNKEWNFSSKNKAKRDTKTKVFSFRRNQYNTPDSESSAAAPNSNKIKPILKKSKNIPKATKFNPKATKTAVVTITSKPGGATYAQILSKAKQEVSLASLGIQDLRMRRAMNGALVMELHGPDNKALAGSLRNTLEKVLKEEATVNNPVATGELRLRGIDPATTEEEISYELEKISGCPPRDIKVSAVSLMRDGMGTAWAYCPLEFAIKIAEKGKIMLGWTVVRIELMKKRPIQCFRCWKFGHVRTSCKSKVDRTGRCFKCGVAGHSARDCRSNLSCVICAEMNKEHRHRLGSMRCLQNQGFPSGVQSVHRIAKSTRGGSAQLQEY